MKTIFVSFLIFLSSSENILFSQQQLKPFVLSPFIGEKLDRVEESYFNLFSGVTSFNEATFYLNADSSLLINIKFYEKNLLKDTLIVSKRTTKILKDRINEVILKDIKEGRVGEFEFITKNTEKYEGIVYSFDSERIKLIEEGFATVNDYSNQEDYISFLSYSNIEKIKIYKKNSTGISILCGIIGAVSGVFIGSALAPEPEGLGLNGLGSVFLGGMIGSLVGFSVGNAIKAPEEYNALDSETIRIINKNSLLPSGL